MNDPIKNTDTIKQAFEEAAIVAPAPAPPAEETKPEPKFLVPYSLLMDFEGGYMTWGQLLAELYRHAGVE